MPVSSWLLGLVLLFQNAALPPKLSLELRPEHEALAPAARTTLAVVVRITPPWHVYHPILLDSGAPTVIEFDAPSGVTIDNLRFPPPTLDVSDKGDIKIETLIYEGEFVVLADVTVDSSVKAGDVVTIGAYASALACIEQCIPVEARTRIRAPVRAELGAATNPQFFEQARAALAPPLAEAPYIKGSTIALSKPKLRVGESAEIVATIRVPENHHIQDRNPGVESLIASRLWIESHSGIEVADEEEQIWPPAHERDMPYIGKVREQSGEFKIRVPLKVADPKLPSGPVELRVLFQYQCCSDAGQCFAPEMAADVVRFEVVNPDVPAQSIASATNAPAPPKDAATPPPDTTPHDEPADAAAKSARDDATPKGLWMAMFFAFLGGLILNVMPCVLPVISIKVISFMQQGGEEPGRVLRLGLAFCAGIMVWFWAFALLSSRGQFPLQYPGVVLSIGTILFVFALNLFGMFEISLPGAAVGKLDEITHREGYAGAFFKGLLATLLGTACTAPFLAGALVYAATHPFLDVMLVFTAAGLGMSAPYLLLSMNPKWLVFVPKPGPWMITFKQAMGFVLLGTVVWLLWVLARQLDADAVVWTVGFWGFVGLAAWMFGKAQHARSSTTRGAVSALTLVVLAVGYWFSFERMYDLRAVLRGEAAAPPATADSAPDDLDAVVRSVVQRGWDEGIPWVHHRPGLAEALARAGYTVYVDYTATWCTTCLANKAAVLETKYIREQMRAMGVIPIEADFTKRDPALLAEIQSFNRPSVPVNVIYPANRPDDVIVLPVVLTQATVSEALRSAGPSIGADRLTADIP